jgi:hypothetical protein
MSKTRAQIIARALFQLNQLAVGQEPEAENVAKFDLNAAASYLNDMRVVDLRGDIAADELADAFFYPFASLVAALHGNDFSWSVEQCEALEATSMRKIRRLVNRAKPVVPLAFDRMTY